MSVYKFELSKYRAVEHAEIVIDGITVLAGENGTGKSTISRFLYYVVKVLSEYESLIDNVARQDLLQVITRMERASLLVRKDNFNFPYKELLEYLHKNSISDVVDKLLVVVDQFGTKLDMTIRNSEDVKTLLARFATLFGKENLVDLDVNEVVSSIVSLLRSKCLAIADETAKKKNTRSSETFVELSSSLTDNFEYGPIDLNFYEDGVNLLSEDHFNPILNLNRVIYYKTYELMDYLEKTSDFHRCLVKTNDKMTDQERMVARVLKGILGGDVVLSDDDFMPVKQLHFKREDGLDIPLKQAATGLVSFSYLARLLENGYLREGTLLIIDEPEAHLHPKWIVEYARILVMLQKCLNLKILLSTHNPDMLAAIDAVARKHGVVNSTNFYFATSDKDNKYQYNYQKLDSIEEIFDSFNTALIKIQEYGQN